LIQAQRDLVELRLSVVDRCSAHLPWLKDKNAEYQRFEEEQEKRN